MRKQLSKSEIKQLNEDIQKIYGLENFFDKKAKVGYHANEFRIILLDEDPVFFYHGQLVVPTLKQILKQNFLKKITVDMGAVKFVVSGADIMRPGVIAIDEGVKKGDFVAVIDQNNNKPLAIGEALFDSHEMRKQESGKIIKNLHYVGDKLWKFPEN